MMIHRNARHGPLMLPVTVFASKRSKKYFEGAKARGRRCQKPGVLDSGTLAISSGPALVHKKNVSAAIVWRCERADASFRVRQWLPGVQMRYHGQVKYNVT